MSEKTGESVQIEKMQEPYLNLFKEVFERAHRANSGGDAESPYLAALARCLLWQPRLVLIDEMTSKLSANSKTWLLNSVLPKLALGNVSCVITSHDFDEIWQYTQEQLIVCEQTIKPSTSHSAEEFRKEVFGVNTSFNHDESPGNLGEQVIQFREVKPTPDWDSFSTILRRHEVIVHRVENPDKAQTLLACLAGWRSSSSGSVKVLDHDFREPWDAEFLQRQDVRAISAGPQVTTFGTLSVAYNLWIPHLHASSGWLKFFITPNRMFKEASKLASRWSLTGADVRNPLCWLSGGNQQKMALAAVLSSQSQKPPVAVIAYFPFESLDESARQISLQWFFKAKERGTAFLFIVSTERQENWLRNVSLVKPI